MELQLLWNKKTRDAIMYQLQTNIVIIMNQNLKPNVY